MPATRRYQYFARGFMIIMSFSGANILLSVVPSKLFGELFYLFLFFLSFLWNVKIIDYICTRKNCLYTYREVLIPPLERCSSGWRGTPGKRVYLQRVSRVRIPFSPQKIACHKQAISMLNGFLTRGLFPSVTRAELGANPVLSAPWKIADFGYLLLFICVPYHKIKATRLGCLFYLRYFTIYFLPFLM